MSHQCLYNYETYIRSKQQSVETSERELSMSSVEAVAMQLKRAAKKKSNAVECMR